MAAEFSPVGDVVFVATQGTNLINAINAYNGIKFLRNATGAKNWTYNQVGTWLKATGSVVTKSGDGLIRILLSRPVNKPNRNAPMWADDVRCAQG